MAKFLSDMMAYTRESAGATPSIACPRNGKPTEFVGTIGCDGATDGYVLPGNPKVINLCAKAFEAGSLQQISCVLMHEFMHSKVGVPGGNTDRKGLLDEVMNVEFTRCIDKDGSGYDRYREWLQKSEEEPAAEQNGGAE